MNLKKLISRIRKGENSIKDFTQAELELLEQNGITPTKGIFLLGFRDRNKEEVYIKSHTFIITSCIGNAEINLQMLKSMENFAQRNRAKLVILGTKPHKGKGDDCWYPSEVLPYLQFNVRIHPLVRAIDLDILPQQVNPLSGLQEFSLNKNGERESSIIASPKQDMEMLPYRHNMIPHALFSTGTISIPAYQDNRIGRIAEQTHVFGGVIVEITTNKNIFNVINFQFRESDGSFIDRGIRYFSNGNIMKETACSMVIGDVHSEEIDPIALDETCDQILRFLPDKIFLHDVVSWTSVNPHMNNSTLERHLNLKHNSTMKEEIEKVNEVLGRFVNLPTKVNVVASNHDLFVNRYLTSGQYALDPVNLLETSKCVVAIAEGKTPYSVLFDFGNSINWMKDTEDFIEHGIQHASHGHLGSGGSKGSVLQFSKTFVKSTTGHTHSPRIKHGAYSVGTISNIKSGSHGYNKGITNWAQANVVLWRDGTRQLLFLWNSFAESIKEYC